VNARAKGYICESCLYLKQFIESKGHVKRSHAISGNHTWRCKKIAVIHREWRNFIPSGNETIEHLFGTAKENHESDINRWKEKSDWIRWLGLLRARIIMY